MALTKVTGGTISTTSNYEVGVITATKFVGPMDGGIGSGTNFVGVVTATGLDINGNADISGNLGVGGTLTYMDVTNVDSVGVGTFQSNVQVGAGISVVGVSTFNDAIGIGDSIIHLGNTDTSIRFPADDTITAEIAGSERVRIASGGINVTGVTTTTGNIHLNSTDKKIYLTSDYDQYITANAASNYMVFAAANKERLRIDSSGKVGIGTDDPDTILHLQDSNHGAITLQGGTATSDLSLDFQTLAGVTTARIFSASDKGDLRFYTANTENLRITSDGVLKITGQTTVRETAGLTHHTNGNLYIRGGATGAVMQSVDEKEALVVQNTYITAVTKDLERLRITAAGELQAQRDYLAVGINTFAKFNRAGGGGPELEIGYNAVTLDYGYFGTGSAHGLGLRTSDTTALFIDTNQRVLIGNNSARTVWGGNTALQVEGLTGATSSASIVRNSNDKWYPWLGFGKSRGTSDGSATIVQSGDITGVISFNGADGGDMNPQTAYIESVVDGIVGVNSMPGRLSFYTTASGAYDSTERLRIDNAGNITAVNTASGGQSVTLKVGASHASGVNAGKIIINNGGTGDGVLQFDYENSAARARIWMYRSTQDLIFDTAGSERLRITSGGGLKYASADSPTSTSEPAQWLNHSGGMQLYASSDSGTHRNIIFCSNSVSAGERMRIASGGGVGINTTLIRNATINIAGASQAMGSNLADGGGIMFQPTDTLFATDRTYPGILWSGNTASLGRARAGIVARSHSNNDATDILFLTRHAANGTAMTTDDERMRIKADGKIGIGTGDPQSAIHLKSMSGVLSVDTYPQLTIETAATDGAANKGGGILFLNHDGTGGSFGGSIQSLKENATSGNSAHYMRFSTRAAGGSLAEALRIHSTGHVSVGDNLSDTHDYKLVIKPNNSDATKADLGLLIDGDSGTGGGVSEPSIAAKIVNTNTYNNATHQYGLFVDVGQQYVSAGTGIYCETQGTYAVTKCFDGKLEKNLGAAANGFTYFSNIVTSGSALGNAYHFVGQNDGSDRVRIDLGGNITNTNNSYGQISDQKLKENIVDANSQWDDIKAIKVRNFNFTEVSGFETHKQIGVVAQEIETVSPGLVATDNDIVVDDATGEGTVTGTTKRVKYSLLYMKAIKALQEAMTRIETLEAKVASLESS